MVLFSKDEQSFHGRGPFKGPPPSAPPLTSLEATGAWSCTPRSPYLPEIPNAAHRNSTPGSPNCPPGPLVRQLRFPGPVQRAPCLPAVGRLAGLDAGLHQLHVRLHALDTRVVELTRGLRQLREAASDTRDAVEALQETQRRAEREHGRLEGESAPRGAGKVGRSGSSGGPVGGGGPETSEET